MNLLRQQQPYVFRPPLYSPWFQPVLHALAAGFRRFKFNIREVSVRGDEALARLAAEGHAILVAPNHADHADPSLLLHVGARRGIAFHFMAAREGFEKSAIDCFVLQRGGVFSVDREGADLASIKTAMNILREGRHPLVVFPEGEIYHHHEELDVLNEGVATILLRASEKMPAHRRSYAVPTAIIVRHDPSVADTFSARLEILERRLTLKPVPGSGIVERIYRYGGALLALKEQELMGAAQAGSLVDRLRGLQLHILDSAEKKHGIVPRDPQIPARIKALRHSIRQKLNANVGPPPLDTLGALSLSNGLAARRDDQDLYHDLDRIFVVQQLYSYPGRYLSSEPTVDRIAETIFKLEEDVLEVQNYPAPRCAEIVFGEPIEIGAFLAANRLEPKTAGRALTERLRNDIAALMKSRSTDQPVDR